MGEFAKGSTALFPVYLCTVTSGAFINICLAPPNILNSPRSRRFPTEVKKMHVSLAEALEVRGGPLQEEEVWAVLSQSAESLQELFHKDHTAMGFIISPWSLLLMPSGNISFTDEYVTQQDVKAFTAPEVLEGLSLNSISDLEKMHMYSLGMTLFWGADYEIPQSQPMKLGEHLNSLLLNMCDDVTLSRMSLRTVLDICSKHIRNSSGEPPFSYIRKLVRLVLGSLSQ
ncbi:unnamed protein product, partial [Menidia menidia]